MMKTIHFLILSLVLQSSLLFSSPWEEFVKDISAKSKAGDADAMGILADLMSDLGSNNHGEILLLAKESKTKGSPYGKYVYAFLIDKNIIVNNDNIPLEDFLSQLEEKASIGDWYAAYDLACIYINGQCGVTEDSAKGINWLRKAVDQGLAPAQLALGNYYFIGKGVAKSETKAVNWYRKATDQGDSDAQFYLGGCYRDGIGVAKNEVEAMNWYRKGAEKGISKARIKRFQTSAAEGNKVSQWFLGDCYIKGVGLEKNTKEGLEWYQKAAEAIDMDLIELGGYYIDGNYYHRFC